MEQDGKVKLLKQWYLNYIDQFRVEYKNLSTNEKGGANNTNNFLNPCQIEIFWIINPDYQFIVQSNFNDRPDKEIIINGPYELHEFLSGATTTLESKRWQRNIEQNPRPVHKYVDTLGKRMAIEIYRFVEIIKQRTFHMPPTDNNDMMGIAVSDTWVRMRIGNIGDLNYIHEIEKMIQDVKQNVKSEQEQSLVRRPNRTVHDTYDGFGIHFFPPIYIGIERKLTVEKIIYNIPNFIAYRHKAFDMKIGSQQIIVNNDGFVFVESKNKKQALKILNLIMACGVFYGLTLHAVREHELVMADYDRQSITLTTMQWDSETKRGHLLGISSLQNRHIERIVVRPETIREILSNTEKLLEYEKLATDMRLFNDGLTHFGNSEFAPSFIMGWSVIERHYSDLWNDVLSKKNIDQQRRAKLSNTGQLSMDNILEFLNLQHEIDENVYDLLMKLKQRRNKFYHGGKQVTKDDAMRCLKYVDRLLSEKIKQQINIPNDLILTRQQNTINPEEC